MKKIFTFIAAMLVAFAVNAVTVQVAPGTNTLRSAITAATAGDVLELSTGVYYEEGNFDFNKSLTIMAAEGTHPVVANRYYLRIEGGAQVAFKGIEFDGSLWTNGESVVGAYDHCMRPYGGATGTEIITAEGCKFHGYSNGYVFYTQRNARKWHALIVKDCIFTDNQRCIGVLYESSSANSCDSLVVENCTFAGTTGNYAPVYVANGNTTKLSVDHCTFYNNAYHCINVGESVTNTAISNCIFANAETSTRYSATCLAGTISNCLSYNTAGFYSGPTKSNNIVGNPLFADAANADYTLEEGSPALGTATNGGNLGDSRWWPAVPSAATTVYFAPGVWNQDGAKYAIYAYEPGNTPEFQWSDFLALAENETNIYTGTVPAGYSHLVFVRLNAACATPCWEDKWNQTRNLTIVEGGKNLYTIDAWGDDGQPSPGTWSTYVAPTVLADGYYLVGEFGGVESWDLADLTAERMFAINPENASEYLLNFTLAEDDEFKVVSVVNNNYTAWYPASPAGNYRIEADHAGAKTIYFRPDGVDHPELNDGWYYGKLYVKPNNFNATLSANWSTLCLPYSSLGLPDGVEAYSVASISGGYVSLQSESALTAGKAYLVKATAAGSYEFNLVAGKASDPIMVNNFIGNLGAEKVISADDAEYDYYILFENEFHLLSGTATANIASNKAYFSYTKNASAPSVLRIVNGATNIQNVEGNETAVKFIENGKLFIKKNGVVYDAVGTVVK